MSGMQAGTSVCLVGCALTLTACALQAQQLQGAVGAWEFLAS